MNKQINEFIEHIETDTRWDTGELGRDEAHAVARKMTQEDRDKLHQMTGIQTVTLCLPVELIEDFQFLAQYHGLSSKALMCQILDRFAESEKKEIARKAASAQIKETRRLRVA